MISAVDEPRCRRAFGAVPVVLGLACVASLAGCEEDLGPCDDGAARTVFFTDDELGLPAYGGQALVEQSCGGGSFCHSEAVTGEGRFGAPAGLDFDVSIASTAEQTDRLRRGQRNVFDWRHEILALVRDGTMPPGEAGESVVALGIAYAGLPPLDTPEGEEILRNWLACAAPVVERIDARPAGIEAVGDIVMSNSCAGAQCGGACVDTATNPLHCGGCGSACGPGQSCEGAGCVCSGGLAACADGCSETSSDVMNCGGCGNACGGGEVCAGGSCLRGGCPGGTTNCGGSCVDVDASVLHCGGCDSACAGGEACNAGVCGCGALTDCGGACIDASSDPSNCGDCGNACGAGTTCASGSCVAGCGGGLTDCGGACVDTSTDGSNCGGCGATCGASELCADGSCVACGGGITLAGDVQPMFSGTCTGAMCHDSTRPQAGINLTSAGDAHASLVGVRSSCPDGSLLVSAGMPDASYLINKLTGVDLCGGRRMPLNAAALDGAEIDTIRQWICAGAPNN